MKQTNVGCILSPGTQADVVITQKGKYQLIDINGYRIPTKNMSVNSAVGEFTTITLEFYPTTIDMRTEDEDNVET